MNDEDAHAGWFAGVDPADPDAAAMQIREGRAETPEAWPTLAVDQDVVPDEDAYYDALREATLTAARDVVNERERADDRQLIHAVRSIDDMGRILL